MMKTLQRFLISLTLAATLLTTVAPLAAYAQDTAQTDAPAEKYTLISASCRDGACAVVLDQDGQELTVAPIEGYPLTWPLETNAETPASVELSDRLVLNLPFGQFQILEGDFLLLLDENNRVQRLNGSAQTVIPTFAMSDQVRIRGPFSASFGYDYGSALTDDIAAPLLPDSKYLFLSLGSGMDIDVGADVAPEAGGLTVNIPVGNSATIVIDPLEPLVYLDGEFVVRSGLPVDMIADMANVELPDVPLLGDLTLPLRTPVGVSMLMSPRGEANFLEVRGGLEVDGGIAQRILKFEGKPVEVNGVARIDSEGIHFASGANSSLLAATPLSAGAQLSVTVPNLVADAPAWWNDSLVWMDEAGAGMVDAITNGWTATGATAGSAVGAVATGAQAAAAGAGSAASAVISSTQAAAAAAGAGSAVSAVISGTQAAAEGAGAAAAPLLEGATNAAGAALEGSAAAAASATAAAQEALCAWTGFCGE